MFALIDCNNFYASCERLFRPDLRNKPIIILSGNDGAIISRSNEAKALGIQMGEPYFKIKDFCTTNKVYAFSSNFPLYGDISQRVMSVIEHSWPEVEIYSIDEAFLNLSSLPISKHDSFCDALQKKIFQYVGIPVSIGIAPTKTLAKAANHVCKKILKIPVFNITNKRSYLAKMNVGDVWGIGRALTPKLTRQGIVTAHDLAQADAKALKQQYSIVTAQTVLELQGISCLSIEDYSTRKSILCSRSFAGMHNEYEPIAQAISAHCQRAYEKLREQELVASHLSVFIRTNRFRLDLPQHSKSADCDFLTATDDIRLITAAAQQCLKRLYKQGHYYKKTGIYLHGLSNKASCQYDLLHQPNKQSIEKQEKLLSVFDDINHKYGNRILRLGSQGFKKNTSKKTSGLKSPAYTTNWNELAAVNCSDQ